MNEMTSFVSSLMEWKRTNTTAWKTSSHTHTHKRSDTKTDARKLKWSMWCVAVAGKYYYGFTFTNGNVLIVLEARMCCVALVYKNKINSSRCKYHELQHIEIVEACTRRIPNAVQHSRFRPGSLGALCKAGRGAWLSLQWMTQFSTNVYFWDSRSTPIKCDCKYCWYRI